MSHHAWLTVSALAAGGVDLRGTSVQVVGR
jgi:hypothetical protein